MQKKQECKLFSINNDFICHNIINYEKFKQLYCSKNINNVNFKIKKFKHI